MRKTNTLAVVSLISALVGWFMVPLAGSIVAIITGHMARKQIRQSHGMEEGDGLALAGLVIGYLGLAASVIGVVIAVLMILGVFGLGFLAVIFG